MRFEVDFLGFDLMDFAFSSPALSKPFLESFSPSNQVDSLSKLFITWDLALNDMELKVAQEERSRDQRR